MAYKNITDISGEYDFPTPDGGIVSGIDIFVGDIPNVGEIKWKPGEIKDLEEITTVEQIDQSRHLRVHINEGRMIEV